MEAASYDCFFQLKVSNPIYEDFDEATMIKDFYIIVMNFSCEIVN